LIKLAKKDNKAMVGKYAYIIGLLLAIVAGLVAAVAGYAYTPLILVILGLVVGFLNVADKNVTVLLLSLLALTLVGNATLNVIPAVNTYLIAMLGNIVLFAGAAAFVVAIKAVLATTKA
jgi:hypothetical protein